MHKHAAAACYALAIPGYVLPTGGALCARQAGRWYAVISDDSVCGSGQHVCAWHCRSVPIPFSDSHCAQDTVTFYGCCVALCWARGRPVQSAPICQEDAVLHVCRLLCLQAFVFCMYVVCCVCRQQQPAYVHSAACCHAVLAVMVRA